MIYYVTGFLFNSNKSHVNLIKKNRPKWQAGSYNGVGGKIELGESPQQAMRREFLEEAGLDIPEWEHVAVLRGKNWENCIFRAFGNPWKASSMTEEEVGVFATDLPMFSLYGHGPTLVDNVRWLIPLCQSETMNFPIEFGVKS